MKTAVLVIDVQHALCTGDYAALDARGVIERINEVTDKARAAGAPVIFIQHESDGDVLEHGSDGWQLAHGLKVLTTDLSMRKTATDSFHHTALQAMLAGLDIKGLVICGLQSDFCVDTTTRRALGLGFPVTLVSDAHSTIANEVLSAEQIIGHHNVTLANIDSFGVRVTLTKAREVAFEA